MGFFSSIFRKIWDAPPKHRYNKRSYAGAARGKLHADWNARGTSGNAEIYSSLETLRNRSRSLCRDDDYARGLIREFIKNVVYLGIGFQAQVKQIKKPKISDNSINDRIESTWKSWCKADYCDVSGHNNFAQLQKLIFRSYLESGEVFIRLVKQQFGNSPVPLGLEVIEADQIADEYNTVYNGNTVIMGVELNSWKRPVAYWFYENHPGDFWFGSTGIGTGAIGRTTANSRSLTRIPASEIIHFFDKERPGVVRGVPLLYSCINTLRHLDKYEEAELVAARAAANYLGIVTSEQEDFGEPQTDEEGEYLESDHKREEESLKPGIIKRLADGESFSSFTPNRPNAAFEAFHRGQLRKVAAGTGISYQEISRDTSQSNFSSARLDMISVRDIWKMFQADFIAQVLQPIYEVWLEQAVLSGALNFGDYTLRPERYQSVKWQPRGWGWVDPEKEQKGILLGLAARTTTYREVFAERGKDFAEELKVMQQDDEMLKEAGINPYLLTQWLFEQENEQEDQNGNSHEETTAANS